MSDLKNQIQQNNALVNQQRWKWKRWDVRQDGKVFWQYHNGVERWITWKSAVKTRRNLTLSMLKCQKADKQKYHDKNKKWREDNRTKHQENARSWYKLNRQKANETKRKRRKNRRENDALFALKCRIRTRTNMAFASFGYTKKSKTVEILGADWETVKAHIEKQFKDGMCWENKHLWHIDHVIPLAQATCEKSLARLAHYSNLQPLWAIDNLKKGSQSPHLAFLLG